MGLFSPGKLPGPPLVSKGLRCPRNAPGVVVFPRSLACWGLAFCKHMSSHSGHVLFLCSFSVSPPCFLEVLPAGHGPPDCRLSPLSFPSFYLCLFLQLRRSCLSFILLSFNWTLFL